MFFAFHSQTLPMILFYKRYLELPIKQICLATAILKR